MGQTEPGGLLVLLPTDLLQAFEVFSSRLQQAQTCQTSIGRCTRASWQRPHFGRGRFRRRRLATGDRLKKFRKTLKNRLTHAPTPKRLCFCSCCWVGLSGHDEGEKKRNFFAKAFFPKAAGKKLSIFAGFFILYHEKTFLGSLSCSELGDSRFLPTWSTFSLFNCSPKDSKEVNRGPAAALCWIIVKSVSPRGVLTGVVHRALP